MEWEKSACRKRFTFPILNWLSSFGRHERQCGGCIHSLINSCCCRGALLLLPLLLTLCRAAGCWRWLGSERASEQVCFFCVHSTRAVVSSTISRRLLRRRRRRRTGRDAGERHRQRQQLWMRRRLRLRCLTPEASFQSHPTTERPVRTFFVFFSLLKSSSSAHQHCLPHHQLRHHHHHHHCQRIPSSSPLNTF